MVFKIAYATESVPCPRCGLPTSSIGYLSREGFPTPGSLVGAKIAGRVYFHDGRECTTVHHECPLCHEIPDMHDDPAGTTFVCPTCQRFTASPQFLAEISSASQADREKLSAICSASREVVQFGADWRKWLK